MRHQIGYSAHGKDRELGVDDVMGVWVWRQNWMYGEIRVLMRLHGENMLVCCCLRAMFFLYVWR